MARLDDLLSDYGAYHRTRGNLVCHAIGITLILYGVVSFLCLIPLPVARWTAAEAAIVAVVLFYLRLNAALAATMLAELTLFDLLARAVDDWRIGAAAFVLGWIFQAIGHARFEKNKPAFFRNLVHLLVGPLFLWNELLRLRPIERS
ncbi:MAG TPA: Mpo1-like protein [Thermoanaerobaculia bacterium]|nr:Mpo1-like protein [Thermoanaerobaculia bacterium]